MPALFHPRLDNLEDCGLETHLSTNPSVKGQGCVNSKDSGAARDHGAPCSGCGNFFPPGSQQTSRRDEKTCDQEQSLHWAVRLLPNLSLVNLGIHSALCG
jgi:hypothetical protein